MLMIITFYYDHYVIVNNNFLKTKFHKTRIDKLDLSMDTLRIRVLFHNVHRFTLNFQGLIIIIVESFPSNITN